MNLLLVGANPYNPTDGVIVAGVHNILKKALGTYTYRYVIINDNNEMLVASFKPNERFDAVVVCGTPWLWDSFQKSVKYRNLKKGFSAHPKAKKVFLGIGSCVDLQVNDEDILHREEEQQAIKDLYKDAIVFVRGPLALSALQKAGIEATLAPCPAYFCFEDNYAGFEHHTLIWCDPLQTISKGYWQRNPLALTAYKGLVADYYVKFKPEVYCAFANEVESAVAIGLPAPTVLYSVDHTLEVAKKSIYTLSGRVHCAVPMYALGKPTGIIPIDSRAYVLTEFGCPAVKDPSHYDKMKRENRDFSSYLDKYASALSTLGE